MGRKQVTLFGLIAMIILLQGMAMADPLDTWHVRSPEPLAEQWAGIAYGNNTFVALTRSGGIFTSPDGVAWTVGDHIVWAFEAFWTPLLQGFCHGANTFAAVGSGGTILLTSPDGARWGGGGVGLGDADNLRGVTYGNNIFIAVGETHGASDAGAIFTSSDGVTWALRSSGTANSLGSVAYGNATAVVVGDAGTILTSPDGVTWTSRTSGTINNLNCVTYGNNTFVAGGVFGTILTSPDGVTWTSRTSGTMTGFNGITYGNGVFVAVGDAGTILTSPDGVTWTSRTSGTTNPLRAVAYNDDTFVAVGDAGTVLQSDHYGETATLFITKSVFGEGTVTSSPSGIDCGGTCTATYDRGTVVTLTASPSAAFAFTGWSGGGCSGTGTCSVTMDAATTVTAVFAPPAATPWTRKADFGGTARSGAVGFSIGAKGYLGTGYDAQGYRKNFWEYDPATDTWTQKADFGGTARYQAVGFSIGNMGYIGTGYDGSGHKNDFWEYEPAANTWTQKADFGGTGRSWAAGFSIGNMGYIGMGEYNNDFWEYDPEANTWTQKADFGGAARYDAVGFSIGSKGYIGTGWDALGDRKDFWEYDPAANEWTQKTDFGGTARIGAVGFSIGGKGYIGTGGDEDRDKNDFWEYDPVINEWTQKADFGGTARWAAVGFSIGSKGYIGTGIDYATSYGDFWEYDSGAVITTIALNVSKTGTGYGTVSGSGISCGSDCFETYDSGAVVTLYASPSADSTFAGWSGGGCSGTGTCTVTMTAATTVIAAFTRNPGPFPQHTLTVSKSGTGSGTVSPSDSCWQDTGSSMIRCGIYCGPNCSDVYASGASVTLIASPSGDSTFTGWSGGGCSGTGTCTLTMRTDTTVTATFTLNQGPYYTLTVSKSGTGSGTVSGNGISCGSDCSETYGSGTVVTLTASPNWDSTFAGWSGGGCSGTGTCTVTMIAATSVTAAFTLNPVPQYTLMVSKSGTGLGTVSGPGISCGSDCSETYDNWAVVTLTASPSADSVFAGWSGSGCSGTGSCTVTMIAATSVTAAFDLAPASTPWTQKADFGGTARYQAVGFSIGSRGYIGTGYDDQSGGNDFWEYDPEANTWTQKADFGGAARYDAVGFSIGSKGYIGTGWDALGDRKDFWEYDPVINEWTQKADFGGTARIGAVGFSIGGKGYIGTGGDEDRDKNDFWEYDPVTNEWTQKADFGGTARWAAVGFSIGGKGYIGTGLHAQEHRNDFWEYDPVTNEWTQKADFGGTARWGAVGFSIGSKGYIGTGGDAQENRNDFWEYDLAANTWTEKTDFGGSARAAAVGFSIGSKGYIGTGWWWSGDFWEYDSGAVITTIALTVFKAGTGSGTVRGFGISCGQDCFETYNSGAVVTITASPSVDSTFIGWWGGGCSGTGTCTVTMTAATSVTAYFIPLGFSDYYDTVEKLYIGYYQRPADPGGLIWWAQRLYESGGNVASIIEAFARSAESQALYGTIDGSTISHVVDSIYMALFNRHAEAEGLDYYVSGFTRGDFTAAGIMLAILNGAQNSDLQSINNKLVAANSFTRAIDPDLDGSNFQHSYSGRIVAQRARDLLSTVTSDSATIPAQDEISAFFAVAIQLPRTGQAKCYDPQGTEVVCAGTGQDGAYRMGVPWPAPRFTAGTAGEAECITDSLTGLMWAKSANLPGGACTWNQAIDYANEMVLCGHDNWRLPNINELESLIHLGEASPPAWLLTQGFTHVENGSCYWSSSTVARDTGNAWIIGMDMGDVDYDNKSAGACYVWPVRADSIPPAQLGKTGQTVSFRTGDDGDYQEGATPPDPRFIVLGECVIDNLTGLMWTRNANPSSTAGTTWTGALDFAGNLNLCGQTDWRLPNRKELMSLVDRSGFSPPLPSDHPFTSVQPHGYWSSTTTAGYTNGDVDSLPPGSNAWVVVMGDGHVDYVKKNGADGYYAVWPVRGGVSLTDP